MADEEEAVVDFHALRKRLNEEFVFINHQKEEIQNEYSKVVSTGDSLFRSLWINGQQWKNLLRLKGGPKFSSECVYAANLLDSISFLDGYMCIGFKEGKYGSFLKALKDDIAMVKSILIVADDMNLEASAFVRTILISLYGSCLFPADQMAVLRIAKCIIEYHLVFSNAPLAIFRGERNSFNSILEEILQTSCPARGFLVSACKETIMNILLDGSMFWTLEEHELLSVMAVSKVRQKFGDPGSPGTTERIRTYMDQSWCKLVDAVNTILKKVEDSLDCLPDIFLLVVSYFYTFSKRRGFTDHQAQIIVLRFLFNQVINPSLLKPQPLVLDMEVRASTIALFNLRKVVEILRTLISIEAGEGQLNLSQEAKTFYDKLDRAPLYKLVDNLLKKVPADAESLLQDQDTFPGIARTSILITKKDLDSLILLLTKLQLIAKNPVTNKHHATEQLLSQESLRNILGHLEGIDETVIKSLSNLSLSTPSAEDLQNELQVILQSFNEPVEEGEGVMVVSMGVNTVDCPGMIPEEKILGMPTPKARRKLPTNNVTSPDESLDTSQLSDSDSNESSSDEKASDTKPETEEVGEDVVVCGFENSFVDFPSDDFPPQETTPENMDPFKIFDSSSQTTGVDQNDPFVNVVSSPWKPPTPPPRPPPASTQGTQEYVLVDLSDPVSSSPIPPLPHASATLSSKPQTNDTSRYSSGSLSSADRHSSTASSSSDGFIPKHHRIQREDSPTYPIDKKGRKKSLKNIHEVFNLHAHGNPKKVKAKTKPPSLRKRLNKKRTNKKGSESLLDTNDVATIIAVAADQEKTAKDICDEIISKYAKGRGKSVSSIHDLTNEPEQSTSTDDPSVFVDEEDLVKDAKNKLRYVLSCGSKPVLPYTLNEFSSAMPKSEDCGSALMSYLKRDLADAVANQNPTMIARLHETVGATANLPPSRHPQLLKELQDEYYQRKPYIAYLVRSHQGLMCTRAFLENRLKRVERDREVCRRFLMSQCVNMHMINCKDALDLFVRKFQRLSIFDEKSEEMKMFLQYLKEELQNDSLWLGSNERQRGEIMDAVERYVIGRVYLYALYAFGETDKFRDDVFHDNVELMCKSIGNNFTALDIKEEYQREAPWFPAQYELFTLSAYKTPVDKLKCIQRCCTTIMALLGMSSGSGAVGADAFTPVLIYVVMHANPRGLLTTVDFINNYLREPLVGEQYYCWMQFCSAIQFIKILLEENKSTKT